VHHLLAGHGKSLRIHEGKGKRRGRAAKPGMCLTILRRMIRFLKDFRRLGFYFRL
jgi:hypothetical protein